MQFEEQQVVEALTAEWGWLLPRISAVMAVSAMGNVFFTDDQHCYWRVCPEELSAEIVARTPSEVDSFFEDRETMADWEMAWIVSAMAELYGEPQVGECFGLVIPAVLGGEYSTENIRRRCLYDYLRYTGDLARQTRDLKDGDKIIFKFA